MKRYYLLIKSWMLIGLHSCPLSFPIAILSRIGLAYIYYFIMVIVSNLINSFGINNDIKIKYYAIYLFVLAFISIVLLIIQDVNDAHLNIVLKKTYTEEIIRRIFDTDIINLQRQEYQSQLSYAIQAMNGTQLFSPTLSIVNMILGSIANVLLVIRMINHVQNLFIFSFLLVVFIIGLNLGQKRNKRFFEKEDKVIPLQRQKSNYSNILSSNQYFQENYIYNYSDFIMNKWHNKYSDINKIQQSENKRMNIETLIFDLIIAFILGVTLIFLVKTQVTLTAGSVIVLIGAIMSLLQGIRGISYFIANFLQVITTLEKVESLKKYNFINSKSINTVNSISETTDDINILNLSFTYPNNQLMIISNINHKIKRGKVTAIVGENGCGKTTLIKLIAGIYKPDNGEVIIDGQNTWNAFNDLQSNLGISVVFQDYGRYQGITLQENISLSDTKINEHAYMYNEFKDEYKEMVGNSFDGIDFSGGQWQKIALMRALSKGNEILIFDEPTASLDPIAERNVYNWLIKEAAGKTLVIVSHRLGSVKNADEIIVMDKGKIIENGAHENLIHNKGKYSKMFEAQAQWYKEDLNV